MPGPGMELIGEEEKQEFEEVLILIETVVDAYQKHLLDNPTLNEKKK